MSQSDTTAPYHTPPETPGRFNYASSSTSTLWTPSPAPGDPDPFTDSWPPMHLGQLPVTNELPVDFPNLIRIREDNKIKKCPLLDCWSSQVVTVDMSNFLKLPSTMHTQEGTQLSRWNYQANDQFPSERIYVRNCYNDIANAIFQKVMDNAKKQTLHMIVTGTPGTGKSFFTKYFIWRLLHPDNRFAIQVPNAIVYADNPSARKGWVYRRGHFYKCNDLEAWLQLDESDEILDGHNNWLIYDGAIPPGTPRCKVLVITSPGNLAKDRPGAKAFHEGAGFEIHFPTWSWDEIEVTARSLYRYNDAAVDEIKERFIRYGGIPRWVLEWYHTKPEKIPLGNAIASADIYKAVNDLGSAEFDHQRVSGKLIHLVPSPDLRSFTYEWASTYVMDLCFERLFTVSKTKIQSLLTAGQGLHMGSLYGILFEPWFHRKITEQGLTIKVRPLEMETEGKKKRVLFGSSAPAGERTVKWPRQKVNRFFSYSEIDVNAYNIPHIPNFPAVDSFSPSRRELFQVTCREDHAIKAAQLDHLKPYFKPFLAKQEKAKLYFVVPPYRYSTFTKQKYVYPTAKATNVKGADTPSPSSNKVIESTSAASQMLEANARPGPPDWLQQWAMCLDVNPLTAALQNSGSEVKNKRARLLET